MHLPRSHKVERATQSLDHRFLDGPEQGRCLGRISPRQPQGMVQFLVMKNPVRGVFSLEFIGRCHIDADIGRIPAKSGPNFPSTLAEGDGRAPNFSQQELGPAQRAVGYVHGESSPVAQMLALPKGICHRHKVIQQDGDQVLLVCCPVRPASVADFAITWQRCIECRPPSMIEIRGMDGYVLAFLGHSYSLRA